MNFSIPLNLIYSIKGFKFLHIPSILQKSTIVIIKIFPYYTLVYNHLTRLPKCTTRLWTTVCPKWTCPGQVQPSGPPRFSSLVLVILFITCTRWTPLGLSTACGCGNAKLYTTGEDPKGIPWFHGEKFVLALLFRY